MRPVWHKEKHDANPVFPAPTTVSPRGTRLISQGLPEEDEEEEEDISEVEERSLSSFTACRNPQGPRNA